MVSIGAFLMLSALGGLYLGRPKPIHTRVNECIRACGLGIMKGKRQLWPILTHIGKRDNGIDLIYQVPFGLCLEDFKKFEKEIQFASGGKVLIEQNGGYVIVKIRKGLPKMVKYKIPTISNMIIPIPIGMSFDKFAIVDLIKLPHMLVSGLTNSGKSNFLHQVIATILLLSNTKLFVMDFKKVEFSYLKRHARVERCRKVEDAIEVVNWLLKEMYTRQEMFEEAETVNIQEYNEKHEPLPYYCLIIDELIEVAPELVRNKKQKEILADIQDKIAKIAALSRALGIHLIIATQRPSAKVMPGELKTHFGGTLTFRMMNADNSKIVLGHGGAEKLSTDPGRAIWQHGPDETEVQVAHLPVSLARSLVYSQQPVLEVPSELI